MAEPIQSANVGQPTDLSRTARIDALRALVLGLNTWVILLLLPFLLGEPSHPAGSVWILTPLLPLGIGVPLILSHRHFAAWLLLGAFPVLSAFVVAYMPQLTDHPPHGTFSLALGAMSLIAYAGGAALSVGRPLRVQPSSRRPLGAVAPVTERSIRRRGRRVLVAVTGAGAFALALVAPAIGQSSAYVTAWGESAREAATLAAVVGGAVGAGMLALIVGPGLRANRARPPNATRSRRRALTMLVLSAIGAGLYVFYLSAR